MKSKVIGFVFYFLLEFFHLITAGEFPLNELKRFADGLNIEGGTIYHKYLCREQIWANLCIVLDRPFENGIEWQELTNANNFPLKEATILDYNEAQVNYAYATIMYYYITHAHQILSKSTDQMAKILIQVHRNTSGPCHVALLEQILNRCFPDLKKIKRVDESLSKSKYQLFTYDFPPLNVQVDYCYGAAPENLGDAGRYAESDIILSFSLIAGLHTDWCSGSLVIPNQHIPFYLKNAHLALEKSYFTQNHLNQILPDLIKNQDDEVLKKINHDFYSINPVKSKHAAIKLVEEDFKSAILLQVDGMFNPSQLPQIFINTPFFSSEFG